MPSLRRSAARVALALGGLLLGVLLAELGGRLVAPSGHADLLFNAPDTTPEGLYLVDHELMLVPAPGFSATARGLGSAVPLRINGLGLRGPEPAAGTARRWLAVGDSFTLSTQVSEEETFPQQLAGLVGVELWNAGVDGYSTWQATGRYRRIDPVLEVEGVLLTFFLGNDLQDNERFPAILPSARSQPEGGPIPRPAVDPLEAWLTRHSFLYAHWRVRARARGLASGSDPVLGQWRDELSLFSREGRARIAALEGPTRRALRELADATRQRGDALVLAVAPPSFVVHTERVAATFGVVGLDPGSAELDAPGQRLLSLAAELGIETCDLTPALRSAAERAPMYLTYDGHWTAAGHRVVAEQLADCRESW